MLALVLTLCEEKKALPSLSVELSTNSIFTKFCKFAKLADCAGVDSAALFALPGGFWRSLGVLQLAVEWPVRLW